MIAWQNHNQEREDIKLGVRIYRVSQGRFADISRDRINSVA
jgi:hypothetical protein